MVNALDFSTESTEIEPWPGHLELVLGLTNSTACLLPLHGLRDKGVQPPLHSPLVCVAMRPTGVWRVESQCD